MGHPLHEALVRRRHHKVLVLRDLMDTRAIFFVDELRLAAHEFLLEFEDVLFVFGRVPWRHCQVQQILVDADVLELRVLLLEEHMQLWLLHNRRRLPVGGVLGRVGTRLDPGEAHDVSNMNLVLHEVQQTGRMPVQIIQLIQRRRLLLSDVGHLVNFLLRRRVLQCPRLLA